MKKRDVKVKEQRPVYLNLFAIRLPLPALVSIMHRVSGLFGVLLIPTLLWLLQESLESQQTYAALTAILTTSVLAKLLLWVGLSALFYHLLAGLRHLIMDMHYFDDLAGSRASAVVTFALAAISVVLTALWIWG